MSESGCEDAEAADALVPCAARVGGVLAKLPKSEEVIFVDGFGFRKFGREGCGRGPRFHDLAISGQLWTTIVELVFLNFKV